MHFSWSQGKAIQTRRTNFVKALYCIEEVGLCHSEKWAGHCRKTDYPLYHPTTTTYLIGLASGHFPLCSHNGTLIAPKMSGFINGLHSLTITEPSVRWEAVAATFPQQALIKNDARQIIS